MGRAYMRVLFKERTFWLCWRKYRYRWMQHSIFLNRKLQINNYTTNEILFFLFLFVVFYFADVQPPIFELVCLFCVFWDSEPKLFTQFDNGNGILFSSLDACAQGLFGITMDPPWRLMWIVETLRWKLCWCVNTFFIVCVYGAGHPVRGDSFVHIIFRFQTLFIETRSKKQIIFDIDASSRFCKARGVFKPDCMRRREHRFSRRVRAPFFVVCNQCSITACIFERRAERFAFLFFVWQEDERRNVLHCRVIKTVTIHILVKKDHQNALRSCSTCDQEESLFNNALRFWAICKTRYIVLWHAIKNQDNMAGCGVHGRLAFSCDTWSRN